MSIVAESDPIAFHHEFWGYEDTRHPNYTYLYSKQREIIKSVVENAKTVVVAGNKLGGPAL